MRKDMQPYLPLNHTPVKGSQDFNNFQNFYQRLNTVLVNRVQIYNLAYSMLKRSKKRKHLRLKNQARSTRCLSRTVLRTQSKEQKPCVVILSVSKNHLKKEPTYFAHNERIVAHQQDFQKHHFRGQKFANKRRFKQKAKSITHRTGSI